jgi:hypothetical protein
MRAKELKRHLSSQSQVKSKRVANILELVASRTLQTWMETKSELSKYKTMIGKKG